MIQLSIDGTSINGLGFYVKDIGGAYAVGAGKRFEEKNDNLTSSNYYIKKFTQEGLDFSVNLLGKWSSIVEAESALWQLYGMLVQPGERTLTYVEGLATHRIMGYMSKGAKVKHTIASGHVVFEVELIMKKTND